MDGISELAKMFRERENISCPGPQLGKVLSPPPEIKVSLEERIILTGEHLIISAHLLANYQRDFEITNPLVSGSTTTAAVGDHGEHSHNISSLNLSGSLKYTDTLQINDEVILLPTRDGQKYYLLDKAVRL